MSDDPQTAQDIRSALTRANRAENDIAGIGVEAVLQAWYEINAPDCEGSVNGQPLRPAVEMQASDRAFYSSFSDFHRTMAALAVEPPFAAFRWTMTGIPHGGSGTSADNTKTTALTGISFGEFDGGRMYRFWAFAAPLASQPAAAVTAGPSPSGQLGSADAIRSALMRLNRAENDIANIGTEGVFRVWDEAYAADFECFPNGQAFSGAEQRERDRSLYEAFPDYQRTWHAVVIELPFAAVRWTVTGTHLGTWRELAPTGRALEFDGLSFFEFEGDRIRRSWVSYDVADVMRQLGQ